MTVLEPHNLGTSQAKARIDTFLDGLEKKFAGQIRKPQKRWEGNVMHFSFSYMVFDISGKVIVTENKAALTGSLPFAAIIFKSKIENTLHEEMKKILK